MTTALDAVIEAVALMHGRTRADILGQSRGAGSGHPRRLAIYVAHTHFGAEIADLEVAFGREARWVHAGLAEIAHDLARSYAAEGEVRETRDRAQAILDSGATPSGQAAALAPEQVAEARRLRARGWSVTGLARRYGVAERIVAPLVGEVWGGVP